MHFRNLYDYTTRSCNSPRVEHLEKQFILLGNPPRITSDIGTTIASAAFEDYRKDERIDQLLTSSRMPRANDQDERVNRSLTLSLDK